MSQIKVDYIAHMGNDLTVVNSARVSYGKTKLTLESDDVKLISYLSKHKHFTPFEHCTLSVSIKCPLFIRSQIHRHRTFSFNEISRRYTSENIEFYKIDKFRKQHAQSKQCSDGVFDEFENKSLQIIVDNHHKTCLNVYNRLIDIGVSREIARGSLPQDTMTEFWMTGNLRNWIHFLELRIDSHSQKEVQDVSKPILKMIMEKFPESAKALFKHQLEMGIEEIR